MRITICILLVFVISSTYGQTQKDSILKKDIAPLVEEMEFMYGYDQVMREYPRLPHDCIVWQVSWQVNWQ